MAGAEAAGGGGGSPWMSRVMSAVGVGGGGSGSLGIWGWVVQAIGHTHQYATNMLGVWGTYQQSKLAKGDLDIQAAGYDAMAGDQIADAHAAIRQAGRVQRAGLHETTNRYLQLGQDVGRIYAGAAAGGIDVSSRSVGRVETAARKMAGRDVEAITATTKSQTDALHAQSISARANANRYLAQGEMLRAQGRYIKRMARSQMRLGFTSTTSSFIQSILGVPFN